ncbi:MAG: hypothetical protein A3K19_13070 [Lentisphaerae bacterium RIFOXYB12_FULL_65_16]|nr:MAG: hypothetical protein A3K18_04635 [Lentisphaerae bacterium RIFOXYA12_64_32]OGV87241.1 MAG: hypothetical protein A3K19_13070 [Lentisphaerae bacterium RIFOXYB12_FULL_65_16]
MNVLGLSFHCYDTSACLFQDERLVAFAEEERFTRVKHAVDVFPVNALKYCLKQGGLSLEEVDAIAFGFDVDRHDSGDMRKFYDSMPYDKDEGTKAWERHNIGLFSAENMKAYLQLKLRKAGLTCALPPLKCYSHHLSHAASAYYCSGFQEAITITMDGSGDDNAAVLWKCGGDRIEEVKAIKIPHSLGWLYAAITEYLGFDANSGEGKVMGLAPYGAAVPEVEAAFDQLIQIRRGEYSIDPYSIFYGKHTYNPRFTDKMAGLLPIPPKHSKADLFAGYQNIAFSLQDRLEKAVIELTRFLVDKTGIRNLCLGGGVALNCKANGKIWAQCELDGIFVQPISSDAGTCLGASLLCLKDHGISPRIPFTHAYLGPEYSNEEIQRALDANKLTYRKLENVPRAAAELLRDDKIIGWFQGRMEAGPRALGGRSILASPLKADMKDRVNDQVKFRDPWRPFCPSVLYEKAGEYVEHMCFHPFMILAFKVRQERVKDIPAVVHVDGTARPQMVRREDNERYYEMIKCFGEMTGVPVVLNTSFNVKGEPIVCSPLDAIRCFYGTGLDALVMGDFLLTKGHYSGCLG